MNIITKLYNTTVSDITICSTTISAEDYAYIYNDYVFFNNCDAGLLSQYITTEELIAYDFDEVQMSISDALNSINKILMDAHRITQTTDNINTNWLADKCFCLQLCIKEQMDNFDWDSATATRLEVMQSLNDFYLCLNNLWIDGMIEVLNGLSLSSDPNDFIVSDRITYYINCIMAMSNL